MAKRHDVLEFAVLGVLSDGPLHGYELRKRLTAVLGPFRALSYGSLYPCLRRLQAKDLIEEGVPAMPLPSGMRTYSPSGMSCATRSTNCCRSRSTRNSDARSASSSSPTRRVKTRSDCSSMLW